jgi:hypothetical protein
MEIAFDDDFSGSYSIAVLIDQEAQMYAVETGQSAIGGLDSILSNLPQGFGSSVYQEGDFLGVLIRNDFEDTEDLLEQFEQLKAEQNTALLLLPIETINFQESEDEFQIKGTFAEIFVTDEENLEGFKRIFDGQLSLSVPGNIKEPKLNDIVENTIVFENDGLSLKTFELVTQTESFWNIQTIILILILTLVAVIIVRQYLKKN